VDGTYYCRDFTVRRVGGGFLAYTPALLLGCTPLRHVYKVRCDLNHLLGEAMLDSSPTRYTFRIGGALPSGKNGHNLCQNPDNAEAIAALCRPP